MNEFISLGFISQKIKLRLSYILFFLSIIYIGRKVFLPAVDAVDFKYFWLAGSLWHEGVNPYGPSFSIRARELFEGGSVPPQWAYPPHFRPIAEIVALMPFEVSAIIWRGLSVVSIAMGTIKLFEAVRSTATFPHYVTVLFLFVAFTLTSTAISISIGQSSPFIFLGYSLLIYGYLKTNQKSIFLALIILMIKPNYGMIPAFFLLGHFRYIRVIILSALVTIALSFWGLWGHDFLATIASLVEAFSKYKGADINLAPEMTGLRHLVYASGFGETSQLAYVIVGSLVAFVIGRLVDVKNFTERDRVRAVVVLSLLLITLAPMHTYDGYFALSVIIPALALSPIEALVCSPLLMLTWRSNAVAAATGFKLPETQTFVGSTVESIATIATIVAFAFVQLRRVNRGVL